jgi:3-oxoacyl-[acyl-carrier protein] reductase
MREDKLAVITGGARGIGAAIAIKLSERVAKIAILDMGNPEAAETTLSKIKENGAECRLYKCDVSNFDEVAGVVKQINNDLGTVDILVNNAGITRDKLILAMKEADFDSVISVNLKGCFNMIHHTVSQMTKKRYGKIVNIASVSGLMGNPGQANYSASKAGVIGITKTAAKELASRNICVNAVAPGFIATDMTESFKDNEALIGQIPVKRMGKPEEVAALVDFLTSSASDYITGEVIRIDGGMAM